MCVFVSIFFAFSCRDGGTAEVVMDQLCATLQAPRPSLGGTAIAQTGSVSDALLLALRGLSLGVGSIGAEEASSFRKVSCGPHVCAAAGREGGREGGKLKAFFVLFCFVLFCFVLVLFWFCFVSCAARPTTATRS